MLKTLYKRGKVAGIMLQWRVWVEGDKVFTEHGQVGGKLQKTVGNAKVAKNVGAKNSTTPTEQAVKEACAAWTKRKERAGYRETIEEALSYLHSVPMLAHKFDDHAEKISYPVLVQPKLDGLRCLAYRNHEGRVVLQGRKVTFYTAPKHIIAELEKHLVDDMILDGELYNHGLTLQDINSYAKKYNGGKTEQLVLHVYDATLWSEQGQTQEERFDMVESWFDARRVHTVYKLPTHVARSHDEVKSLHDEFVEGGYEGAMVRTYDHEYEFDTRSHGLLKLKDFMEEEFEIIGVKHGRGKAAGWPIFVCANPKSTKDKEFDVLPMGTDEQKRKMLQDGPQLIGRQLTVRFLQWTPYGQPEQPRGVVIRDDI